MLLSICLILSIACGGAAITYLFSDDESLLWRFAAGNVIGSAVFGAITFLLASVAGLEVVTVLVALVIVFAAMVALRGERRKVFLHDWQKAKGKLQGATFRKSLSFVYYTFFLLLLLFFFDRAMIVNDQGILTGGSQNLGDLPFHLGIIYSFTEGANFPPLNPSFAGAKFSYPFVSDLITAAFIKLGIGVREAMLVQNVGWAFSLLVILERFVFKLVNDRLASKLAPALLFFSGGLGFLWFFSDHAAQSKGFFEFLWNLLKDYTIGDQFRWGNSLVTLFITQRSLLLGMPITLVVLGVLWKIFATEDKKLSPLLPFSFSPLLIGIIAGLLPLIHLHSLFVLFVVTAFLFLMKPAKWREWTAFGIGVCITALPELIWSMTGSATQATEFFAFHFGWDSRDSNFIWFWIKNTGIAIPLIAAGIYFIYLTQGRKDSKDPEEKKNKKEKGKKEKKHEHLSLVARRFSLLHFYIPFAFLFVLANVAKLAPWEWDNIKVLIYWFVGSIPFIAFVLAWMWRKSTELKIAAALCFVFLIFSGALDVWRTISGQINYKVFDADAVTVANRIRASTPPNALFLNAPTYNTAIVLTGRRSLMRYPGHLSSHGIDYKQRENEVKEMYRGGTTALGLMEKYGIEYVLVSPEERSTLGPNEEFFKRFPAVAEAGQYKVYKVK